MAFGKAKPPAEIAWRPDFRIPERLPDIKPVRTDFFINFAAITFSLFAVLAAGFQEFTIRSSYADINNRVAELKTATSEQEIMAKADASFAKTATFLKEYVQFVSKHLSATDLLLILTKVTPPEITLESARQTPVVRDVVVSKTKITNTQITLVGYIREADTEKASVIFKQFKEAFFQSPELKGKTISHNDDVFMKDNGMVRFNVRIEITTLAGTVAKTAPKGNP